MRDLTRMMRAARGGEEEERFEKKGSKGFLLSVSTELHPKPYPPGTTGGYGFGLSGLLVGWLVTSLTAGWVLAN